MALTLEVIDVTVSCAGAVRAGSREHEHRAGQAMIWCGQLLVSVGQSWSMGGGVMGYWERENRWSPLFGVFAVVGFVLGLVFHRHHDFVFAAIVWATLSLLRVVVFEAVVAARRRRTPTPK